MIEEEYDRAGGLKLPDQPWHLPSDHMGKMNK